VDAADRLSRLLNQIAGAKLGVVSWIMLAASVSPHRFAHEVLDVLWPLVLVVVGTLLLCDAFGGHSEPGVRTHSTNVPCSDCA
jgi:hypothetical protein